MNLYKIYYLRVGSTSETEKKKSVFQICGFVILLKY